MPGPLVTAMTTAQCGHLGSAKPTVTNPRVKVNSQPTVAMSSPYAITGCPFTTGGSPQPCLTAKFTTAATRVKSGGQPLLLVDSQATTVPNGVPVMFIPAQARVIAQ